MRRVLLFLLTFVLIREAYAQWQPVAPVSEAAFVIATKGDTLFAGAYGGLYRSTNDGVSWKKVKSKTAPYFNNINDLVSKIFVDDSALTIFSNQNIYKSLDNGVSWKKLNSNLCYDLFVVDGEEMVVTGKDNVYRNLFRTLDGGKSWVEITDKLPFKITDLEAELIKNQDSYFYLHAGNLYASDNQGNTWTEVPLASKVNNIFSIRDTIYCTANKTIFTSSDNGKSWLLLDFPAKPSTVSINKGVLFVPSDAGIYTSSDRGTSWAKLSNDPSIFWKGNNIVKNNIISFNKKGWLIAPSAFGVSRSTNSGQYWLPSFDDEFRKQGCAKIYNLNGNLLGGFGHSSAYAAWPKVCVSDDDANTWTGVYDFATIRDVVTTKDKIILVDGLNLYFSYSNGKSWQSSNQGFSATTNLAYNGNVLYLIANYSVFSSTDLGQNWTKTNFPATNMIPNYMATTSKTLFVANWNSTTLLKSSDNGNSWSTANLNASKTISSLYAYDDKIVVGTADSLYISIDEGQNWRSINNNLATSFVECTFANYKSRLLMCRRGLPIHISDPNLTKWTEVESSGYNFWEYEGMLIKNDVLYLAEGDYGVFKRDLREILVLSSNEPQEKQVIIYPNPSSNILYFANTIAHKAQIFDISGKPLAHYVIENNSINVESLTNGFYTIELETENGRLSTNFIKQ